MKKLLSITFLILSIFSFCIQSIAWDGYDYDNGTFVEIEKGNLVREGETIEVYDYSDGSYHDVEIQSLDRYGNSVELDVYDNDSGESRTLEMDE
jgi:hypothetical protein